MSSVPPQKGITPYTLSLVDSLSKLPDVDVEIVGYRAMYPRFLFPGGDVEDRSGGLDVPKSVRVSRIMSWWDPSSWLRAGLVAAGDIVHGQWWSYPLAPSYATMLFAAKRRRRPVVLTLHNVFPHERSVWKDVLNGAIIRLADHLIVHSERMRDELLERTGIDAPRLSVIPHGLLRPSGPTIARVQAKGKLGLPKEARVILCFGHIRRYKGIDTLLTAFRTVAHDVPSTHLLIAGQPWVDWKPYERQIDSLGLRDRVTVRLGFVPTEDVGAYFGSADVVALPYDHFDAQSGIGSMALAYGRAAVVSDVGGLPDTVGDRRVVVPPGDAEALAAALKAVTGDADLREKLERDANELAKSFGWEEIAEKTVTVYRGLLGARR